MDTKNEIWKDITGYKNLYQVSNTGKIRSLIGKTKILKPALSNAGYLRVVLSIKNKRKNNVANGSHNDKTLYSIIYIIISKVHHLLLIYHI